MSARRSASSIAFVFRDQMAYQFPMVHLAAAGGTKSRLDITAVNRGLSSTARLNVDAGEYLLAIRGFAVTAIVARQRVLYALSSFASLAVVNYRFHEPILPQSNRSCQDLSRR